MTMFVHILPEIILPKVSKVYIEYWSFCIDTNIVSKKMIDRQPYLLPGISKRSPLRMKVSVLDEKIIDLQCVFVRFCGNAIKFWDPYHM